MNSTPRKLHEGRGRVSAFASRVFSNRDTIALFGAGLAGFVIKVSAAVLSLLMFAAIARVTNAEDFGTFGFAFSLATILGVLGSMGQRMFVLKSAAIQYGAGNALELCRAGLLGGIIVLTGTAVVSLLAVGASFLGWMKLSPALMLYTGIFGVALALIEFMVHFFRGFRSVSFSMIPRDIVWRLLVIAFCAIAYVTRANISVASLLMFMTVVLFALSVGQFLADRICRETFRLIPLRSRDFLRMLRNSRYLWGTAIVQTIGGPVFTPVILGFMLSPGDIGPFFAAMRIALVMDLFTMAAGMAISPLVARMIESGDKVDLQRFLAKSSLAVSLATFLFFIIFTIYGGKFLAIINPEFSNSSNVLTILSFGYLISVLCGPIPDIMELSGLETVLLKWLIWSNFVCLAALLPMIHLWGMVGAAICVAGLRIFTHTALLVRVIRDVGVNPSVLSIFRISAA